MSYLKEVTLAMNCYYLSKQEFNEFLTKLRSFCFKKQ